MVPYNRVGPRILHVLFRTTIRKSKNNPVFTRFVSTNEENERLKYDQARNDIILSTIKSRPDLLVNAGLQRKLSMSWKSILLGMVLTSTATMGLFVSLQLLYSRSFGKGEHKIQGIGARVAEPGSTQDAKTPRIHFRA